MYRKAEEVDCLVVGPLKTIYVIKLVKGKGVFEIYFSYEYITSSDQTLV